jgi:glycosyltransferase involved in cell wall biosynthesis
MRLALVHDWLTGMRGGEKVLEAIAEVFPDADIFTLVHVPGSVSPLLESRRITTSFIQRLPGASRFYRHYLPLFPMAVEQFDTSPYDMVVSVSHCAAKSIIHGPGTKHLCYCLTPMRYAWDQFDAYFGAERVGRAGEAAFRPVLAWLARWDAATANRADEYVAISRYVAARIARYYTRQAGVVYPPVDTGFFRPDGTDPSASALVVSALVPYKRIDLAIESCSQAGTVRNFRVSAGLRVRVSRSGAGFRTRTSGPSTGVRASCCCRVLRISASCRSRHRPADGRWWRWRMAGRWKP